MTIIPARRRNREKWFAWLPVRAGGSPDGTRKTGWVWLCTVEVIVKPQPAQHCPAVGGVYRKLSKVDDFGWVPPTLATDKPIYSDTYCDCPACERRRERASEPHLVGVYDRLAARDYGREPHVCNCPTCRDARVPARGEADQFGGPRVVDHRRGPYFPEGGD